MAISSTTGYTDAAVLYMWPAVWTAFFFGTWGTVFIIGWVGAVHGLALIALPPEMSNVDRWIDVVVAVLVVACVVRTLAARNERLVANLQAEARVDPLTGLLNAAASRNASVRSSRAPRGTTARSGPSPSSSITSSRSTTSTATRSATACSPGWARC